MLRIFTSTVANWYRKRHVGRGLAAGETGAVTAIQRANSDLRFNPHSHTLFLDGVYGPDGDGKGQLFHPALASTQADIEQLVERVSRRILRFLQRRGVIILVTAPGDGEVTVVTDESLGEKDPLLARLLAAATAGAEPAGPANKRQVIRIVLDPDERPVGKGTLCAQAHAFNLQAATRVAANDKPGRERLCRHILWPALANDRLKIFDDGKVRLDFKRPWSDGERRGAAAWGRGRAGRPKSRRGTTSVDLEPLALIARLAALVPPPQRHLTRYCSVLSSHSRLRSQIVPKPAPQAETTPAEKPARKSRYIPWAELLRRTFSIDIKCGTCGGPLRLIALIKTREVIERILVAMHLTSDGSALQPARPPPASGREATDAEDWVS